MFPKDIFIRNIQADDLLESFFVSAVSSLLIVRFYLFIAGYPQIGGGNLHIAHMLWGGLFMFVALIISLSFLSRNAMTVSAITGGAGFGIFIDELGKFITRDNNYFYQPAIAIIYVIFILIYFLIRTIPNYRAFSKKEYLINALEMIKEAVVGDLDRVEEQQALEYLKMSDTKDPVTRSLLQLLDKINSIEPNRRGVIVGLRRIARHSYVRLTRAQFISKVVVIILAIEAATTITAMTAIFITRFTMSFDKWAVLITALLSTVFIFAGVARLYKSKLDAFSHFKTAIFILIFLTQFFLFYSAQLQALIILLVNLAVFTIIEYVLRQEREKRAALIKNQ